MHYDCKLQNIFSRWDYSGEEPVPPPYSFYTMFTLKDTFFASFILLAIHLVVLSVAKTIAVLVAVIAVVGATFACVALVPVVARIGGQDAPLPPALAQEA